MKVGLSHSCNLDSNSEDILGPGTSKTKQTGWTSAIRNFILKMTLISEHNSRARIFFRSHSSIYFERKRHLQSRYLYIVHPFSMFRIFWEAYMVVIFVISMTMLPFNVARNMEHMTMEHQATMTPTHLVLIICDVFGILDVLLCCFTGYENNVTRQIFLNPRKIFWFYFANGGFFLDFITSSPFQVLRYGNLLSSRQKLRLFLVCLLKVIRSRTLFKYSRHLLVNWQINMILFKLILYLGMSMFILHWTACIFIIIPKYIYMEYPEATSWLDQNNMRYNDTLLQYQFSIYMATGTFLCIMFTHHQLGAWGDIVITVVVIFLGYILCIYIFVIILQMVLSSNTPATKYQSIMSQLSQYMRHRQLPIVLQHRLDQYYNHRFRKTYFRESAIMPILSERLQTEINLHCYTTLVESVSILQHLPDDSVSQIVSNLRSEIFLPNDIIIKAGTFGECMYFIASGTVAVSTPTGREVCHLQDGAYFGEVALIRKDHKRIANVVAIEICEVYKLESKVFKKCLADHPDTFKRLEKICQDRFNRTNFLEELHKKHILEKSMARKHEMD